MDIVLQQSSFVNNKFSVNYGTRQQATFTIIDESFAGLNTIGEINKLTCFVSQLDNAGNQIVGSLVSLVIGLGDGLISSASDDTSLRGKLMSKDNMEQCTVTLTEL